MTVSGAADWVAIRKWGSFKEEFLIGDIIAGAVSAVLLSVWTWRINDKMSKVDAYQASSYYAHMRITSALQTLQGIQDNCDHNYDSGHEMCRAASKKEMLKIKNALGQAPSPEIVQGNKDLAVALGTR